MCSKPLSLAFKVHFLHLSSASHSCFLWMSPQLPSAPHTPFLPPRSSPCFAAGRYLLNSRGLEAYSLGPEDVPHCLKGANPSSLSFLGPAKLRSRLRGVEGQDSARARGRDLGERKAMGVEDRNKEGRKERGEEEEGSMPHPPSCPEAKPIVPSSSGEEDSRTLILGPKVGHQPRRPGDRG